jgi:hypothetical protein
LVGGIIARRVLDSDVILLRPVVRGRGVLVTSCGWGFLGVFAVLTGVVVSWVVGFRLGRVG